MRNLLILLALCILLTACQSQNMPDDPSILADAVPIINHPTESLPTNSNVPSTMPIPTEAIDGSELNAKVELCDEIDWEIPGMGNIRTRLRNVTISGELESSFYDNYLHLSLSGEYYYMEYRLESNGSIPGYHLYPCNITGSGRDILVSKGTTSNGIAIWTYDLFTLSDSRDLELVSSSNGTGMNIPAPNITVRKVSSDDRVMIYAKVSGIHEEICLVDEPTPIDSMDWVGGGIYFLEEGVSTASLLWHQETVVEDVDGDGKDELRYQFYLGSYKAWYGHVTAWFSYTDGEWTNVKVILDSFDEDGYYGSKSTEIPAREIKTALSLSSETIDEIAASEDVILSAEDREYINTQGDVYRSAYDSRNVYSVSTDDPTRFEVMGLTTGSPVWEMHARLGNPDNLYGYEYFFCIDDGTTLQITTKDNRIVRLTLIGR